MICILLLVVVVIPTFLVNPTHCLGECGGDFTGSTGELSSPNYPLFYSNDDTCNYTITVSSGLQIMLEFNYFETQSQSDYVYVYNGDTVDEGQLIDKFSGTTSKPPVVFSSGNNLLLMFQSDDSTVFSGFYATFTTIPGGNDIGVCGGTYTATTGVITSPLYPLDHGDNQDCAYLITTDSGNVIELEFLSFKTEYNGDTVTVYDGSVVQGDPLGEFSGTTPPGTVTSTGSTMYIHFTSDYGIDYFGFSAIYRVLSGGAGETNEVYSVCSDDVVSAVSGTIQSHSTYPDSNYPANSDCTLYIRNTGAYEGIYLTFQEIDLTDACGSAEIVVTDGTGLEVATICYSGDTYSYETTTGQFAIKFTSTQSGNGFKAIFNQYYEQSYSCSDGDFHCENDWCIPEALQCDGTRHCSDSTDESCSSSTDSTTIIIIIVVIFIFLAVSFPTLIGIASACKKGSAKNSTAPKESSSTARTTNTTGSTGVAGTPAYMQRPIAETGGTYDPAYPSAYGAEAPAAPQAAGLPAKYGGNPTSPSAGQPYNPAYPGHGGGDNPPGLPPNYSTTYHA